MTRLLKKKRDGFTLVEIMISVAILGILFLVGPSLITNIIRFEQLSVARLETQRNARDALSQINRELRQATSSSIVISQESGQPYYSSISFSTIDGRAVKYFQSGQTLYSVSNGSTTTFATGLRYIAFAYPRTDNSGIISVSLTFQKDTYQGGNKALQMAIEQVRVMN